MRRDLPITISSNDLALSTSALYNKYEKDIISAFGWVEGTQSTYRNTIDSAAPFLCGIPFSECTVEDFDSAIAQMNEIRVASGKSSYSDSTIKGFRSVFRDLCVFSEVYSKGLYYNTLWGSYWRSDRPKPSRKRLTKAQRLKQAREELTERIDRQVKLPRSLTIPQEIKLLDIIRSGIQMSSFFIGLAILYYMGVRPGECCGVTFGDIRPLAGYPGTYCMYVYTQITRLDLETNKLKTFNAYRILPVPTELLKLIFIRKKIVEDLLHDDCSNCFIVCEDDTEKGLRKPCNRKQFRIFCQTILRKIDVEERVVTNLSNELRHSELSEKNVTSYLLRRNYATSLLAACGMDDDELKYLMGHDIGVSDEKRHDFVNPDVLFQLWKKLNRRSFEEAADEITYTVASPEAPILLRQKETKIVVPSSAIGKKGLYIRIINEFPNDFIHVSVPDGNKAGVKYRTTLDPVELKRIGRITIQSQFAVAVVRAKRRIKA